MKCERCGKELSDIDLYCQRCGKAVFPEYMDEDDVWAFYKSDEEVIELLQAEGVEELPEALKKEKIPNKVDVVPEETEEKTSKEEITEPDEVVVQEQEAVSQEQEENKKNKEIQEEDQEQPEIFENSVENVSEESPEESPEESGKEMEVSETGNEEFEENSEILEKPESKVEETQLQTQEEIEESQESKIEAQEEQKEEPFEEDTWDFDEDEDEDEEEDSAPILTPQMKKARRWKRLGIVVFLATCLGMGIYLGLHRMKEMEKQEKQYYENLKKSSKEPMQTQGEEPQEPAEDASTQTQTPTEEPKEEETPEEEPKEEEPPKEEAKKEYFKQISPDEIDFSKYTKIQPASTEENSVKQSESYDYSAKSVVDGDATSSWQENEEGIGEGKGFKLNLDKSHKIRYIVLTLGNWRSDQLWEYNARPKILTIQVGEQKKDVEFSNEKKKFCLSFEEPLEAGDVSMYIKEAYEGSRWQDTCISEIELYE